ncbi:zinc finger CCCH domain-containing protein 41 [Malania oleifera]|uniref:zinc finger CCCH domain-containing protein 41 n=1 Tax=Malania oleifera TaxID=397392 RepID=UPI0025AE4D6F|nr:zinc finger CCCH domain-containing protein 41 [Malania oleifera]XP_057983384.1 zinc finger CCCH domain-containing protein 41 [Malania oleifera]
MELKVSSPKPGLSPSDCVSDPEEKEVSDDDDDDRNHKHRRRDTRSQSLERDAAEQVFTRPFRRRNKPFENGHSFRESDSQSSETWKSYNSAPLEKDLSAKFEKRRTGLATLARSSFDLNQRIRVNQSFSGDPGLGRGRGRDSGTWNQRDSRFNSVDIASQMIQQGSVPPSLYAGRGMSSVSNAPNASWGTFGLIPGMPNGGLDTLHSLGLQGTLRPPITPSLSMGIPRQRCRDFEERGFCLRGDMCPMEHGVNRIVVEDVQSLSQFNLPVSLPSAHLLGTPAGPGPLSSVSPPSGILMNSKGLHNKNNKPGMTEDGVGLNGAFTGSAGASGADLYDPDQPLWNNCPETSSALLTVHSPKIDETESLLDADLSANYHGRLCDSGDNDRSVRSTSTTVGSQNTSSSVWGRIGGSKNRMELKEKIDSTVSSLNFRENESMEDQEVFDGVQGTARQGKRIISESIGSKAMDFPSRTQSDSARNIRKPSQKALRTLFVNGIPQKNNKKEALLLHFKKFGEVVDIYIPSNSERAFVQFSKREEAEAALKAPDAVMGNRFIKLWWANRDSISDDGINSGNGASIARRGALMGSVAPNLSVNAEKDNPQYGAHQVSVVHASDAPVAAPDHSKAVGTNSPRAPPLQKKLDNLELLKEELRKKQEMLDQKRNDFRRQLDKLQKATGLKGEVAVEQAAKKQKIALVGGVAKDATPKPADAETAVASIQAEMMIEKNKSGETVASHSPKTSSAAALQEPTNLKQSIRPLVPVGTPFLTNRFKLDNRPTGFKVIPPLPTGFENVAVLKEHFSSYGDLSTVELDDFEAHDGGNGLEASKNCSACITFATRQSAERAFLNGKCWQGHNLQFMWLMSSMVNNEHAIGEKSPDVINEHAVREKSPSALKVPSDADVPVGKLACTVTEEEANKGNGEAESSERTKSGVEHIERDEEFQSSPSLTSHEKQLPEGNVC